jgi:hypothetical protein
MAVARPVGIVRSQTQATEFFFFTVKSRVIYELSNLLVKDKKNGGGEKRVNVKVAQAFPNVSSLYPPNTAFRLQMRRHLLYWTVFGVSSFYGTQINSCFPPLT